MKVSIITVCYNAAATLADALQSVASQSHDEIEHIVIDGASSDETMAVVERFRAQLAVVISEPDRGIYDAMNKGIALASGDIIGILNADDVYANTHIIAQVVEAFKADDTLQGVYGDLVYVAANDPDKVIRYWKLRPYRDGLFEQGWMPAHPTFFVRREVYREYGAFDLDFSIQSDFELCMRFIAIRHIKTRYLPGVMVRMRMGGVTNNSIGNVIRGNIEAYRACRKHGLPVTPLFVVKKVLSRIPQFFKRNPSSG